MFARSICRRPHLVVMQWVSNTEWSCSSLLWLRVLIKRLKGRCWLSPYSYYGTVCRRLPWRVNAEPRLVLLIRLRKCRIFCEAVSSSMWNTNVPVWSSLLILRRFFIVSDTEYQPSQSICECYPNQWFFSFLYVLSIGITFYFDQRTKVIYTFPYRYLSVFTNRLNL